MDFAAWLPHDARVEDGKQGICELIDSAKVKKSVLELGAS